MGSSPVFVRPRAPLPPPVLAILWLDAVLVAAGALWFAGKPPLLAIALPGWSGLAFVGAGLTAATAALAAFMLAMAGRRAWAWLPVPAVALWLTAISLDCMELGDREDVWGARLAEARLCVGFLVAAATPLLALMVFMLRRAAPQRLSLAMVLGGLASAGAAASLLALVNPHPASFHDIGVHALALVVILVLSAAAAHLPLRMERA